MGRTAAALIFWLSLLSAAGADFTFDQVRAAARDLAAKPYVPDTNSAPAALRNLTYAQYQQIQFKHSEALWAGTSLPFAVEFFHPGFIHQRQVILREVSEDGAREIRFSTNYFDYGTNKLGPMARLGFAGFRIVQPGMGEVAAFLGGTYFRMIGRGQNYGASARLVAVNTVEQKREEFPAFREFWLRRPLPGDKHLNFYALYDSPSLAGCASFQVTPGEETVARVHAVHFPREPIRELGIAAITSMFLHDENNHAPFRDFRPEVHDSDGLLLNTKKGEWLWRPLEGGKMMRVNTYADEGPRGFGLLQRERRFERYQDTVAAFQARPNVWIRPIGTWGAGAIELVQLPSDLEFMDNTVAFWRPAQSLKAGDTLECAYEIHWSTNDPPHRLARALDTRIGTVIEEPPRKEPNMRFVIDFEANAIGSLAPGENLKAEISVSEGAKFVADTIQKIEQTGVWRLVVEITHPTKAVDLRARLKKGEDPVTENWIFTWQP